jgi:inorganic pyrophosphatase
VVIDRPKGSHHPHFPEIVYPVDYGYLEGTTSMDGDGIDVWRGTDSSQEINAVICTADILKRDSEVKILLGCTAEEKRLVLDFNNHGEHIKGILISRFE